MQNPFGGHRRWHQKAEVAPAETVVVAAAAAEVLVVADLGWKEPPAERAQNLLPLQRQTLLMGSEQPRRVGA